MTSSDLRKFEKHPHSWTFTSTPPLGHCPRDVSSALRKIEKHPHSWTFTKGGGPTLGPMLKSLHRGPKGGVRTPWTPPLDPPLLPSACCCICGCGLVLTGAPPASLSLSLSSTDDLDTTAGSSEANNSRTEARLRPPLTNHTAPVPS